LANKSPLQHTPLPKNGREEEEEEEEERDKKKEPQ